MRLAASFRTNTRIPLLQAAKTATAAVLSWLAALAVFPDHVPVFAAIAAIIVVQPSVNQSFGKAVERSIGVLVGVFVALGAILAFGDHSWLVLLAIVASVFVGWLLRLTPGSGNQIPITAMLVLTIGAATPDYAIARIFETLIGAAVGVLVNVAIVPPQLLGPARLSILRLGRNIAETLDRLATALSTPMTPDELHDALLDARKLRELRAAAAGAVRDGRESLTMNPRRSRYRAQLETDAALFARLEPLVTRTIGMSRALRDHWDDSLRDEPAIAGIAEELRRAAHDLRLLVQADGSAGASPRAERVDELPALTKPLVVINPNPQHWILIGALLEDLRRVREEIVGEGA